MGQDRIRDFKVGQDKLGLTDTIEIDDLSIRQGGSNTIILQGTERIAVLINVEAELITANNFTQVIFAL
ncbi:MAG: hypothetical protein VKL39_10605 [Leptolyngbyaceae bacterium]|nr:hypothetical protein [Leptolyngbyaceae bacterium]